MQASDAKDMDLGLDGLGDEALQQIDPALQRPQGDGVDGAVEGWRVAQRGKARNAAEIAGKLANAAAAKKANTSAQDG